MRLLCMYVLLDANHKLRELPNCGARCTCSVPENIEYLKFGLGEHIEESTKKKYNEHLICILSPVHRMHLHLCATPLESDLHSPILMESPQL